MYSLSGRGSAFHSWLISASMYQSAINTNTIGRVLLLRAAARPFFFLPALGSSGPPSVAASLELPVDRLLSKLFSVTSPKKFILCLLQQEHYSVCLVFGVVAEVNCCFFFIFFYFKVFFGFVFFCNFCRVTLLLFLVYLCVYAVYIQFLSLQRCIYRMLCWYYFYLCM